MRTHESMQRGTNSLLQRVLRAVVQTYLGLLATPSTVWYCKSKNDIDGHYSSATACHYHDTQKSKQQLCINIQKSQCFLQIPATSQLYKILKVSQRRARSGRQLCLPFSAFRVWVLEFISRNDSKQSKKKMGNSIADCTGMSWKKKLVESLKCHFSASAKITSRLLCFNINDTGETGNINCSLCCNLRN